MLFTLPLLGEGKGEGSNISYDAKSLTSILSQMGEEEERETDEEKNHRPCA